MLAEMTDFM